MSPVKVSDKVSFDYQKLDKNTIDILNKKENIISNLPDKNFFKLGRELKNVQSLFSNNSYSCFQEWYESLGFKRQSTYNYINYYRLIAKHINKKDFIKNLPKKLSYEIARPSVDSYVKEKVLSGDITSYKQYKKFKKDNIDYEKHTDNSKYKFTSQDITSIIDEYEHKLKSFNDKISDLFNLDKVSSNKSRNTLPSEENNKGSAFIYDSLDSEWCSIFKSYIDVYRSKNKTGRINKNRHFRLLNELYKIYKSRQFTFNGEKYSVSKEILKKGLEIIINRGIDNLNYARKIWITKLENKVQHKYEKKNKKSTLEANTDEDEILDWMEEVNYLEEFPQ